MEAQYALLGFLELEPNYGYELKKLYDRMFAKQKPILSGQVYSTLARLKRDEKVIEVSTLEKSEGPGRVKYKITKVGLEHLTEWLSTPEEPASTLQTTLYIKTVLALLRDQDANNFLLIQRESHMARMRELTKLRQEASLANKLLIDYSLFHLDADLKWIELTQMRLTNLKKELKNEFN